MTYDLRRMLFDWYEASTRPGILSRAGHAVVVAFRAEAALYFTHMAGMLNLDGAPENHYGLLEPHVRAVMRKSQHIIERAYTKHAKRAFMLSGSMSVFSEAGADTPTSRANEDALYAKLDRLGLTGKEAVDYITSHGALLIKGIDEYTLKVMRSIIAKGVEEQLGVAGTVRLIRAEFQAMGRVRAKSIATTEINDAMSEAALQKIKKVKLDGKRWIRSPGACPLCEQNAAEGIIPVDQPFKSGHLRPPGHPGKCRCAVAGARLPKAE